MTGFRYFAILFIAVANILVPTIGYSAGVELKSREYKIQLKPASFTGDAATLASTLWETRLKPAITAGLEKPRKSLKAEDPRHITFRDTAQCTLSKVGLSFRERADWTPGKGIGGKTATTLKLRGPDKDVVSAGGFEASGDSKTKLEEDISLSAGGVAAAKHNFAYSSTRKDGTAKPANLGALLATYDGAENTLTKLAKAPIDPSMIVESGQSFVEFLFTGPKVDLSDDEDAELDITFWYPANAEKFQTPSVVEVSFAHDIGKQPGTQARGEQLADIVAKVLGADASGGVSKTSLALPKGCQEN